MFFVSYVFAGENCECKMCYPVGTNAQVPVQVTRESVTQLTIRNGIFDTFDDANKKCCDLLAQQQNRPHFTNGKSSREIQASKMFGMRETIYDIFG